MNVEAKFQELSASFRGVNWNNPGSWPVVVKASFYVAVIALVLIATYALFITKKNAELNTAMNRQAELLKDYEEKAFKAMNLDAYKKQLVDMEEAFGALLRQLPKDTEVPSLLEDITHTGLGSGLEFATIDLGTETRKEFYAELPINIIVTGDYHGFGAFVSGVASLPRIVTLHDFNIIAIRGSGQAAPRGGKAAQDRGPRLLQMKITAKTYRYSDAVDAPAEAKGKKAKKAKKPKGGEK